MLLVVFSLLSNEHSTTKSTKTCPFYRRSQGEIYPKLCEFDAPFHYPPHGVCLGKHFLHWLVGDYNNWMGLEV